MKDDAQKTKNYVEVMAGFNKQFGLQEKDYFAFVLFHGVINGTLSLDENEKQLVSEFIVNCVNNPTFKTELNVAIQKMDGQHYQTSADKISELAYRIRHLANLNEALNRVEIDKIRKGKPLPQNEMLTLQNYATMREVASLSSLFNEFKKFDLIKHNPFLTDLDEKIRKSRAMENAIELISRIHSHFSPGLFSTSHKKKAMIKKHLFDFFSFLKANFITIESKKRSETKPHTKSP